MNYTRDDIEVLQERVAMAINANRNDHLAPLLGEIHDVLSWALSLMKDLEAMWGGESR